MSALRLRRLGFALGVEITGLDLQGPVDDETIAEIRQAWLDHIVVCFPGQDLSPQEQMAFCGRFGQLDDRQAPPFRRPDVPIISLIVNKPVQIEGKWIATQQADKWHSDRSFADRPASATFLLSKELPEVGGDTMFANLYLAYESLSPAFKRMIDPLEGVHDVTLSGNFPRESAEVQAERVRLHPPIVHPLVRTHPETGRKALFAGGFLRKVAGMTEEESQPLTEFFGRHATSYEFVYRHRWKPNDLLMWDNRCALHVAVQDYDPSSLRRMQRCQLIAPISGRFYKEDEALRVSTPAPSSNAAGTS
jgi:taurine dioxygenase